MKLETKISNLDYMSSFDTNTNWGQSSSREKRNNILPGFNLNTVNTKEKTILQKMSDVFLKRRRIQRLNSLPRMKIFPIRCFICVNF